MFTIDIDTRGLSAYLKQLSSKGIAYSMTNAINAAAKRLQVAERDDARKHFTIRSTFFERQVGVIKPFASVSQQRPFAEISVGQRPRLLAGVFESGGARAEATGSALSAVPIPGSPARPSFAQRVPAGYRYTALGLQRQRRGARKGKRKTFEIKNVGIFQRVGKGPQGIRMLYKFEVSQRVDARLEFIPIALRLGPTYLAEALNQAVFEELERMKR